MVFLDGMILVIVESPTKAKTLETILGKGFTVKASMGHIRDLPKSGLGVDVEHNFEPQYVVPEKGEKVLRDLKKVAKDADFVVLATDPDREGEAIAWHLKELLKPKNYGRAVFHEITKEAVKEAFDHKGTIDVKLVDAQQARRVLDRLVGYKLSPLLWKKVRYGLSAGRVQSVAVRLVVDRERERDAFTPVEYWSIGALFSSKEGKFSAQLVDYIAVASTPKTKKIEIANKDQADKILQELKADTYTISKVARSQKQKRAYPPFKTSTLQQSSSNVFGFPAYKTMKAAQGLFEKGLITYHRTDSLNLSSQFIDEARGYIHKRFGKDYVPETPNYYKNSSKNAQEAHEAIRITGVANQPSDPKITKLGVDEQKVYSLIWRRSLECQMAPAVYDQTSVDVTSTKQYVFRAVGSIIKFPGFLALAAGAADTQTDEDTEVQNTLPELTEGEGVKLLETNPAQHFTQPPARYSDASLVKALEELGIGRPSTYAPTIQTIQARGYIEKEGRYFRPTDVAYVVTDLLVKHFESIVNYQFTAKMEEELDEVALGELKWQPVIKEFYEPFAKAIEAKDKELKKQDITFLGDSSEVCPKCGRNLIFKLGKYGKFMSCSDYPKCEFAKPVEEVITTLLGGSEENDSTRQANQETDFGVCEVCNEGKYILKQGRFGKFLACSRYPECKSTKPYLMKIGVNCPECKQGDIVVKKAKGRTFYGCSRYPECKFSSWKKPVTEKTT